MKLFFLTILTISFFFVNCSKEMEGVVSTKSGLILRSEPKATANKIDLIPYNGKVTIIDKNGPEEIIGSIKNNWYQVKYNSQAGWAFGGFITTIHSAKEDTAVQSTITQTESKEETVQYWSPYMGRMHWNDAKIKCASIGMRLPTKDELKMAYAKKITKSWKDAGNYSYWSSSSGGEGYASTLNISNGSVHVGTHGYVGVFNRDSDEGVRCIR